MRPFLVPIIKPSQVIYDFLRELYDILSDPNSETSKTRETKRLLHEVQRMIDKEDEDLPAPPNLQKEKENLGAPQSTVKLMGVFAWLPKGRVKAPKKSANGSLPR